MSLTYRGDVAQARDDAVTVRVDRAEDDVGVAAENEERGVRVLARVRGCEGRRGVRVRAILVIGQDRVYTPVITSAQISTSTRREGELYVIILSQYKPP